MQSKKGNMKTQTKTIKKTQKNKQNTTEQKQTWRQNRDT